MLPSLTALLAIQSTARKLVTHHWKSFLGVSQFLHLFPNEYHKFGNHVGDFSVKINLNLYLRKKKSTNGPGFFWVLCLCRFTGVFGVFQNGMNDCRVTLLCTLHKLVLTNEIFDYLFSEKPKLKFYQMLKCLSYDTKQKPKHLGFSLFFLAFC